MRFMIHEEKTIQERPYEPTKVSIAAAIDCKPNEVAERKEWLGDVLDEVLMHQRLGHPNVTYVTGELEERDRALANAAYTLSATRTVQEAKMEPYTSGIEAEMSCAYSELASRFAKMLGIVDDVMRRRE
jgi:hypothetical protein